MFNIIVIALILNPNGGAVTAVYWTTKDQSHQQQRHHNRQNWTHIGINQTSTYCCDNSIAIGIIFVCPHQYGSVMVVGLINKRTLNFLSTALMLASVREASSGLNLTMSSSLAVIRIVGSSWLLLSVLSHYIIIIKCLLHLLRNSRLRKE